MEERLYTAETFADVPRRIADVTEDEVRHAPAKRGAAARGAATGTRR